MTLLLAAGCGLLGLLVGSFLNVVIHRVPRKESVVTPRSRCPGCGTQLAERDNIPVLSWLLLRGRCRTCAEPISARYPAVELATGAIFVIVALRIGLDWVLPAYLVFIAALLAISIIDLEHYKVPNRIVFPTLGACVAMLAVAALLQDDWGRLGTAFIGSLAASASLLVINLIYPRGMGMGDVKLALLLGLFLGWIDLAHVALGMFLGFLLGAVGGITLIALKVKSRKDHVPFAPFLAGGTFLALLVGDVFLDWYLGVGGG
jgi:leader peptidase (prepilin peptidase) / N-methyltransferase